MPNAVKVCQNIVSRPVRDKCLSERYERFLVRGARFDMILKYVPLTLEGAHSADQIGIVALSGPIPSPLDG